MMLLNFGTAEIMRYAAKLRNPTTKMLSHNEKEPFMNYSDWRSKVGWGDCIFQATIVFGTVLCTQFYICWPTTAGWL